MSLIQILTDIAPEMADLDAAYLNRIIGYASAQVSFCNGVQKKLAIAYLAAHTYTMANRSGASGSLTSIKEGDLAKSFGGSTGDAGLNQTGYGQEFLRLRRSCVLLPRNRWVIGGKV